MGRQAMTTPIAAWDDPGREFGFTPEDFSAIARKANMSERSVRRGLDNLKAAGVLDWQRRKLGIFPGTENGCRPEYRPWAAGGAASHVPCPAAAMVRATIQCDELTG